MKTASTDPMFKSDHLSLKARLKEIAGILQENEAIRLHRAISWIKCAEENEDNPDLKFIALWISFNACYAEEEVQDVSLTEKKRFREFISKLVACDVDERIFHLLWHKFSGPIRLLIDNQYAFAPFWNAQRGLDLNWERRFDQSKINSRHFLAHQQVPELLRVVLDRLYTVRNQLLHGGATYQSQVNRAQVKDAGKILQYLMPVIISTMMANTHEDWGLINYPVVE